MTTKTESSRQGAAGSATDMDLALSRALPHVARAHWALFLPTIAIALLYGSAWAILALGGAGDGALARLCLIVAVTATPLLGALAFFRYQTVSLALVDNVVIVNRGGPGADTRAVPITDIAAVSLRRGLAGRFTKMATVRLDLRSGRPLVIAGLADPRHVVDAISAALADSAAREGS